MTRIDYYGRLLEIDEKMTLSQMKSVLPLFFKNSRKGEKKTAYRGCLIVEDDLSHSDRSTSRSTHIYAVDTLQDDIYSIGTGTSLGESCVQNPVTLGQCKKYIDAHLAERSHPTITMSEEVVSVNLSVKVKTRFFRDHNGEVTSVDVLECVEVDTIMEHHLDKTNLGKNLATAAWNLAERTLAAKYKKDTQ